MTGLIKLPKRDGVTTTGSKDLANNTTNRVIKQPDVQYVEKNILNANLGRMGFIIDTTGSRDASWTAAKGAQVELLNRQNVSVRLITFGGDTIKDTGWQDSSAHMLRAIDDVTCQTGRTMILPSVQKFLDDVNKPPIIVLIGDAFEENVEDVSALTSKCRLHKIKIFSFFEDTGCGGEEVYRQFANETEGAFAKLGDALGLKKLVEASNVFAVSGAKALVDLAKKGDQAALALAKSMKLIGPG